jgi:hypothetical protein
LLIWSASSLLWNRGGRPQFSGRPPSTARAETRREGPVSALCAHKIAAERGFTVENAQGA